MDKDYIYQAPIREWIENDWGKEIFVPLYGSKKDQNWDIFFQSYLIPITKVYEQLETDTYDFHGSLSPGITVYGAWDSGEAIYHKWCNDIDIEPIVIKRNFNGLANDNVEIVEEFRFLFNLYYNSQTKEYIDLENEVVVIKVDHNNCVNIHKKYLKSYLAIKEMAIIMHIDSRCVKCDCDEEFPDCVLEYRNEDNTVYYTLNIRKCQRGIGQKNDSILFGKKVLFGCELKDCNIWPYNEEKKYIDFIIGIDDNGKEIYHTCDPSKLQNYFGANPTAPHYLTPVFFDSAVLNKYYSKPEIYKVEDCIIRCGSLWSLYIDNQNKGYVSAYLGDLGRDLPSEQELHYWRGFNKVIDGKLSEVKYKRDFMAQATNPQSIDFIFKNTYLRVNRLFDKKFGWSLFLELDEQDLYNFEGLRVPINNSIVEMDMLILSLVKVLLDSLNEKNIIKQLTGTYEKLIGSISKLEAWFQEKQLPDSQDHIKFLRNLQELRSSGTGHRKGKGYKKISNVFDVQKENYAETFISILESAIAFLNYVDDNLDKLT
ncbi:hypothetical protein [Lacrimispora algidixylanolytica]|uniref:Uncharacterized protein n=1 Tax=Lacrimispora algidixylanolytica TaxID=94868 RepID=A0A419T4P5_9FIRM|nr:hypothetical protein [Lacrimispora algidixylanolytica]RKD32409.1 hypothetical protein BET01_03450 [Lacrimispora algidixylanolytica]